MRELLEQRAVLFSNIRAFFLARNVLEVDTPLLWPTTLPDPNVPSISAQYQPSQHVPAKTLYLQTSPEFFMKRLLAAGSGSIFQISKAFRNDCMGKIHQPEFTMLEWYREGFDHHDLMQEMDVFLQAILKTSPAEKVSYQAAFQDIVGIDPLSASIAVLRASAEKHHLSVSDEIAATHDKDLWLNLLMSHVVEKNIGKLRPCFVYDFPASQAALARINPNDSRVAERFEVYFQGVELANGFHELNDSKLQRARFLEYQQARIAEGLSEIPMDEAFLNSLDRLPNCAGVALGIDRLLMIQLGQKTISNVLAYSLS